MPRGGGYAGSGRSLRDGTATAHGTPDNHPGRTTPAPGPPADRMRETAHSRARVEGITPEAALEAQKASNPMRTLGDPGDFGAVVAFLCSQQAKFITGESVLVDGGSYAGLV